MKERKVFAVGVALIQKGCCTEGRVPHLIKVTRRFVYLKKYLQVMTNEPDITVASFPNILKEINIL